MKNKEGKGKSKSNSLILVKHNNSLFTIFSV